MRRQQLTETEIAALFDPPMGQRELVRHYTLSAVDIAMIRRRRGDHSRLGHALMLCYLRHPGRPLRANERPPSALVSFVAEQIDVLPESTAGYLASEQNRRRQAAELQEPASSPSFRDASCGRSLPARQALRLAANSQQASLGILACPIAQSKTQPLSRGVRLTHVNPHSPDDVAILSALDTILI
jgi:hypothetical protein